MLVADRLDAYRERAARRQRHLRCVERAVRESVRVVWTYRKTKRARRETKSGRVPSMVMSGEATAASVEVKGTLVGRVIVSQKVL